MDIPISPDSFGAFAGFGAIFVIGYLIVMAIVIVFAIWIQYTIIWKAVRRGLRELHYGGKVAPQQNIAPPTQ